MRLQDREKARDLRKKGLSLSKIGEILKASKSSVSLWVRDIILTPEQKKKLSHKDNIATRFSLESGARLTREAAERHKLYKATGYQLSQSDIAFRILCALYWGEGGKTDKKFVLSNSDPDILKIAVKYLKGTKWSQAIKFRCCYHSNNEIPETEISKYWSDTLQLDQSSFTKFSVIDTKKYNCKQKGKLPYGVGYVVVNRVELLFMIFGGIEFLKES